MMPDFKTEIEPLPGWCSEAKFRDIYDTVRTVNPLNAFEIGVFGGRSLAAMASAIRDNENKYSFAHGVDPYKRESIQEGGDGASNHDWWTQEYLDELYTNTKKWFDDKLQKGLISRLSSSDFHKSVIWTAEINILHIDGNHSELCSCRDVSLYMPLVGQGGIIYFDDINWPTTLKAQGMLAEQCDLLRVVDQCAVYRKR